MNSASRNMLLALVAVCTAAVAMGQGTPTPAPQADAAPKPAGMKVFYASHSLMWDMPPVLQQEAEAYGINGHQVLGIQRLGVSRTSQHWDVPDNQNEAKKALISGKVDAFVMSPIGMPDDGITNFVKLGLEHNKNTKFYIQVSWPGLGLVDNNDMGNGTGGMPGMGGGMPGFGGPPGGGRGGPGRGPGVAPGAAPGAAPSTAPAAAPGGAMIDPMERLFEVAAPGGAAPGGGRGGFGGGPGGFGGGPPGGMGGGMGGMFGGGGQDYNKTPEEIAKINVKNKASGEEQAKKLNEQFGNGKMIVFLVPTDQAHNALRLLIAKKQMPGMTDQGEVFRDFIGHPTEPVIALNTYVHFAVMYQRSPVGLPIPAVLKNAPKEAYRTEEFNKKLEEIAWDIVSKYEPSGVPAALKEQAK